MKGLFAVLALVCLFSPTLVLGEPTFCMIQLVSNRDILQNIPSEESRVIMVDYQFGQYSTHKIVEVGFDLDKRYHSEEETNDFFANTEDANLKTIKVNANQEKPTKMGDYRLFYFVKYTELGSEKVKEVRLDIPISFIDLSSKVALDVTKASGVLGLIDEAAIGIEQEDPNQLEFTLTYTIPKTGYQVLISEGHFSASVDWNSVRFPIPEGQIELYPVVLKYKKDGKSGEVRRFVPVQRPTNATVSRLFSYQLGEKKWEQGELVAFTHSLLNVALRAEDFETDIHPLYCTRLYCSGQGSCQRVEPFFKKCKCDKGFEGVRCTMKTGDFALVNMMFLRILQSFANGSSHKTSSNDAAEIVSRLASIHTIVSYEIIDEELKLISMIAPGARVKGLVDPLTKSVKSICDRLTNLAMTVKFKHTEKEEFERIGRIEHKFDELLIKIARSMNVEEPIYKQITRFIKRNIEGPTAKDKLTAWFKNLGKDNSDGNEYS